MADFISFTALSKTDDRNQALTFFQGSTFTLCIEPQDDSGNPVSTTGYAFVGQFRSDYDSNTALLTFQESDGSILNDTTANKVYIKFVGALTKAIRVTGDSLDGVYDFQMTAPDGSAGPMLYGTFSLQREVTRV